MAFGTKFEIRVALNGGFTKIVLQAAEQQQNAAE
jgi:hypothetical protein